MAVVGESKFELSACNYRQVHNWFILQLDHIWSSIRKSQLTIKSGNIWVFYSFCHDCWSCQHFWWAKVSCRERSFWQYCFLKILNNSPKYYVWFDDTCNSLRVEVLCIQYYNFKPIVSHVRIKKWKVITVTVLKDL